MKFVFILFLFISSQAFSSEKINIFSMNTHCFFENWQKRIPIILDKAIELNSDFLNLQEICISKKQNMNKFILHYLYKKTGKDWHSNLQYMHLAWNKYDEYIGLYTYHKPEAKISGYLPKSPLQRAYNAMKWHGKWFVGLHLEHSNDYAHYRKEQISFLYNIFGDEKSIFMGDFNSNYTSSEQFLLYKKNWRPYFPGVTYPSSNPYKGIDGFWLSSKLNDFNARVIRLFTNPIDINNTQQYLSDHYAVFLTLKN